MEKFSFGYSIKNIAIPSERAYKMQLMEKVELVIKRMRWKFIFANADKEQDHPKERHTHGLKTSRCPPVVKELSAFENELCELINKVKFRRYNYSFQSKLNKDIGNIKASTKVCTPADKTSNWYKISKEEHKQLLSNAVTSTYKKCSEKIATRSRGKIRKKEKRS